MFGSACYIEDSFPSMLYLAYKYADSFEKAVLTNTNVRLMMNDMKPMHGFIYDLLIHTVLGRRESRQELDWLTFRETGE